jgi:hypothetical protein
MKLTVELTQAVYEAVLRDARLHGMTVDALICDVLDRQCGKTAQELATDMREEQYRKFLTDSGLSLPGDYTLWLDEPSKMGRSLHVDADGGMVVLEHKVKTLPAGNPDVSGADTITNFRAWLGKNGKLITNSFEYVGAQYDTWEELVSKMPVFRLPPGVRV